MSSKPNWIEERVRALFRRKRRTGPDEGPDAAGVLVPAGPRPLKGGAEARMPEDADKKTRR